jgi:hypothetical protein
MLTSNQIATAIASISLSRELVFDAETGNLFPAQFGRYLARKLLGSARATEYRFAKRFLIMGQPINIAVDSFVHFFPLCYGFVG